MNRPSPVKLALLETSWLTMGSTQPASPAPRLLTALCLAGRGASPGAGYCQHRRRTKYGGADRSLAQGGGAIEFCHQPARKRGDDTGVISE